MSDEFWFIVFSLTGYRLSELLSHDAILEPLRRRVNIRAARTQSRIWLWMAEWISCPLCVGVWFAFGLAILYFYAFLSERYNQLYIFPVWLGMAGIQCFLSSWFLSED